MLPRLPLPFLPHRSPLEGRVVLVTGASSGIGEAVAIACAARGAQVLLVARRADELERVAAEIREKGGSATTYALDLTDAEAVDALVKQVNTEQGGVDYLVNNAGRSIRRSIELSYDRFHDVERTMAINYFGPVRLTMGLLPGMRERHFGHVVNIVTWGVTLKAPKFSAYIASKTALDTWSRVVARETRGDNVTFTNVRMSLVQTPMTAPTKVYRGKGYTVEEATAMVMDALERRPLTVQTAVGRVGQLAEVFIPNTFEAVVAQVSRMFPDSEAAKRR
ncbi:SDR family NAD(P)-dependent oxidoreductase [Nocardioides sp. Kera G14]|uniref:SDR family NAD(P)-dependent oxidoreductase n=1 Tax=Nocardioides sp. Kera G14 TaxID=2884264 RepID=UPI001D10540D|nr:SDR family NAD(P)-dependent oxidoreductase [Nocardioides sp. Kera G14]UDY23714.1 SDR family NAD(P)-dependent oxidoreductase [Nocardioides sp. Kera G14]